jgi:glycosyltransferase involved in cell wall biosynthesis
MATGLPCVAPPSAGGDEVLADGAGVVPPTAEPADLAAALAPLLADPAARAAQGDRARRAALGHAPGAVADAYEALYRRRGLLPA